MAQLVLVGLAVVERVMPELQVDAIAVNENHRAHTGAERNDQFDTVTRDRAEALHVSIIGYAHRALQRAAELFFEREIVPALAEVRRGIDDAVLGLPRKTNRYAVELSLGLGQLADDGDHLMWRRTRRRRNARAIGQRAAAIIEQLGLDAGATD